MSPSPIQGKVKYVFSAPLWKHDDPGGWYFLSVPNALAREIREHLQWQEEGWGRLKASAQIGDTRWDTAIWFDTKRQTYLLPVKASIRKITGVVADQTVPVVLWV